METKTDNELIAEFMGVRVLEKRPRHNIGAPEADPRYYLKDKMKYDTSWDWLMPVVEKIEEDILFQVEIHTTYTNISGQLNDVKYNQDSCFYSQYDTKLTVTFAAVVDFIKWYNSQPQKHGN